MGHTACTRCGINQTSRSALRIVYTLGRSCQTHVSSTQRRSQRTTVGRGGNMATRKRNRDREEPPRPNVCTASDPAGFSTFKVEPHAPSKHIFSEAEGTRIVTEWILFRRVFVTKFLFITVVKFQRTNNISKTRNYVTAN